MKVLWIEMFFSKKTPIKNIFQFGELSSILLFVIQGPVV